ncbi:glycosyltransferase [Endozoicomonas sp. SESOKO2]|uniref:glycosyltransferase n=1 Tax=Endozoicomonas sp. SESOKO2 TaxID=2828743 RepID=UPI002147DA24|nr:glycosyltransferase [Endozoicomonas sp. SESOKO2]
MFKIDEPTVSIITAVFNGERHIEETILSVINQTYKNIEYIIIDGGSTDGTVDIIKKYERNIKYWISEKDKGISDAFNKGVLQSSGDFLNFQGDGDGFCSNNAIAEVMNGVDCQKVMLVSARIKRIDKEGGGTLFVKKYEKI